MRPEELAHYIDHTSLSSTTAPETIEKLCGEARYWGFASVCIPPSYVCDALTMLRDTPVHVGTIIGFPLGHSAQAVKLFEAETAQNDGADEIDMVMHLGRFKAGDYAYTTREVETVIAATPGLIHKVIIECGALTDREKETATHLVADTGADYVKTSTGFGPGGATAADVRLLAEASGGRVKVKASGGIRDLETTLALIGEGARRIGTSSAVKILTECRKRQGW